MRAGTIITVTIFERARKPAYKITADFGEFGILQTSSKVVTDFSPEELIGKQIVGYINLGDKNIAGFTSQFLLLGFANASNTSYIPVSPLKRVKNGLKLC